MNGIFSGDPTKDILGKGLIVHEGTDDFIATFW
jgi:Cu-Zn family superoxide dismutase